jgi:hypothetical protein
MDLITGINLLYGPAVAVRIAEELGPGRVDVLTTSWRPLSEPGGMSTTPGCYS